MQKCAAIARSSGREVVVGARRPRTARESTSRWREAKGDGRKVALGQHGHGRRGSSGTAMSEDMTNVWQSDGKELAMEEHGDSNFMTP